jgi:hypothetical protein
LMNACRADDDGAVGDGTCEPPAATAGQNGRMLFVQDTKDSRHLKSSSRRDGHIEAAGQPVPPDGRIQAPRPQTAGSDPADERRRIRRPCSDHSSSMNMPWPSGLRTAKSCAGLGRAPGDPPACSPSASEGPRPRLTTNTLGGHDIPGDFSPDGSDRVPAGGPRPRPTPSFRGERRQERPAPHRVEERLACCQASWSPDGTRMLFASRAGSGRSFDR